MSRLVRRIAATAAGALVVAFAVAVHTGDVGVAVVLQCVVGVAATVGVPLGVRAHRPSRAAAWGWITAGSAVWSTAAVLGARARPEPGESWSELPGVVYLGTTLLLTVAMYHVMFHCCRGVRLVSSLDGSTLFVGFALLAWVLARPTLDGSGSQSTAVWIGLAAVVLDITMAAAAWSMLTTPGSRSPAFRLVSGAIALKMFGDVGALVAISAVTPVPVWVVVGLLSSQLLWAAGALHPSMPSLTTEPPAGSAATLPTSRLAALLGALLIAPAAAYLQARSGERADVVVAAATAVLIGLTLTRMALAHSAAVGALRTTEHLRDDMTHQATHDPLTGLANRMHLHDRLTSLLATAGPGSGVGVLFVDLDHFKSTNDALGHAAGDAVIREVGRRLSAITRAEDCAARQGGDEFVVALGGLAWECDVVSAARRTMDVLTEPVAWEGRLLPVRASIGVAFSADAGTDADTLLQDADTAAYRAKAGGRGRIEVHDDDARQTAQAHVDTERGLGDALRDGGLVLHYQPVVDLHSGRPHGWEALIRWQHPDGTLRSPDTFIPVAEASDLICDIGRWVLHEACRQLVTWTADDHELQMAVNVSARHLLHPGVVDDVVAALTATGARAGQLVVEVTETVLISSPAVADHLRRLRELGVRVAIDDFGTGYTSIAQFQHLPADVLKIDRSLTASEQPRTADLVLLIIRAAHAYGLAVVAEGIETVEQHHALAAAGAQLGQGWLFGRPQPATPAAPQVVASIG